MKFIFVAMVLFAGGMTESPSDWHGDHLDELIEAWGPPDHVQDVPDGAKIIIYVHHKIEGSELVGTCMIIFKLNGDGIIVSSDTAGDYCEELLPGTA